MQFDASTTWRAFFFFLNFLFCCLTTVVFFLTAVFFWTLKFVWALPDPMIKIRKIANAKNRFTKLVVDKWFMLLYLINEFNHKREKQGLKALQNKTIRYSFQWSKATAFSHPTNAHTHSKRTSIIYMIRLLCNK